MTFAAKRRLDALVGGALCGLLNPWVRALGILLRRDHRLRPDFKRIWVLKFVGIGSLINATPFLRSLRETYAEAEVTLITFSGTRLVGERLPQFDRVLTVRDDSMSTLAGDTLRVALRAWRERPELLVDLEVHSTFSTFVSVLTMIRNRAGFCHSTALFREGLHTHLLYYNRFAHVTDCYLQLGEALGCRTESTTLEGDLLRDDDTAEAEDYLGRLGVPAAAELIVLNPNASSLCRERAWPAVSFAELAERLAERGWGRIFIVGAPHEREAGDEIVAQLPPRRRSSVHVAAGELSFGGTLALLKRARLVVSIDSGLLHLAVALGTDTVCLSGPSWPGATAPRGKRHRAVYEPIYCSPCLYMVDEAPCAGENLCMQRISPQRVLGAALELLTDAEPAPETEPLAPDSAYLPGYMRGKSVPLADVH